MAALLPLLALMLATLPALAEGSGVPLDFADRQWLLPEPPIQMDMDPTLVPVGRGAIFVPCMSHPLLEPAWSVLREGEVVQSAPAGTRIVVEPGTYTVAFGSGTSGDRIRREVSVLEGKTALVEPDWSGLRVQVVDENSVPFRGLYELVALPEMENLGVGHGAQVEQGESLLTWVVEPGLYMLLKVGESYQARRDFYTVRLRPGHLEQVTLVIDPATGSFIGAGETTVYSAASQVHRDLLMSGILGGGISLTSQSNITGVPDQTELAPSFYLDFLAQFAPEKHYLYARLNSEEAFTNEDWERFEKTTDFLRFDGLYAYRLLKVLGPYVRFGLESTLFPGYLYFDEETQVTTADGQSLAQQEEFRLSDPFAPLTLKGGAGLRFNTLPSPWFNLWALLGAGGRYTWTGDMYRDVNDSTTPAYEVETLDSFYSYGLEATVVMQLTLTRWVIANTEVEAFAPFDDYEHPTLRWDNNLGLRITSFVSVNYIYRLKYEPELNEEFQHDHQVQLRFSYKFF
jgi:hypothetical protein